MPSQEDCIYISDAQRDIEAGYGYISNQNDPTSWQADAMIDHPREKLKWI